MSVVPQYDELYMLSKYIMVLINDVYIFIWNWSRERDVVINLWVNEKQAKGTKGREIVGAA